MPQALEAPIDVEFDNIKVKADRVTGLVYVPPADYGYTPWFITAAVLAVLILALWWWSRSRRKND